MNFEKYYVLDTNIILGDAQQLITIGQNGSNLVILPETVIDEIDNKKTGFDEINFQARQFGRILADAEVISTKKVGTKKDITIMRIKVQDIFMDIISFQNYELDGVEKSIVNDRKIIKVAQFATKYYKKPEETIFLSNDIMCRTRAISLNVKTESISTNKELLQNNFIKEIEIESTLLHTIDFKPILDFDPDYLPENYCYVFKAETGHQVNAFICNGMINTIDDDELSKNTVRPLNRGQIFAMAGMAEPRFDVCIIEALAGSGKTLLAVATGMKMIRKGIYDKIIYIRNSVESVDKAEEVGFLPGMEEKFKIYNYPLYDTLEFIVQKDSKKLKDNESVDSKIQDLIQKFNIETMWPGSIRGRTISNAFVIIDEVQNFAKTSLQTVLSRMDKDCKVICIGSNRQIDHPYVNKYTNGLSTLLKVSKEENDEINIFGTELNKVVRGKITEWTERIFERK